MLRSATITLALVAVLVGCKSPDRGLVHIPVKTVRYSDAREALSIDELLKDVPGNVVFTNISTGTVANDGAGDSLRTAMIKINAGFASVSNNIATNSAAAKLNRAVDNATNITFFGTNIVTPTGAAVARSLEARFGDEFDARDRTIAGDATDDTAALQDLLDDAGEHAVINLGRGNYIITNSLKFRTGQKIRGQAGGPMFGTPTNMVTRITHSGASAAFEPYDRTTNTFNVEISGIDIAGDETDSTIGIDLYRTSNAEIRGNVVHGFQRAIVMDANVSNQSYFNNVVFNEFGYNSVAGVVYQNGANGNTTIGNKIIGNPYGIIQTNTASANTSASDYLQGAASPDATIHHVWVESGVFRMTAPYVEASTSYALTNATGGKIEFFAPNFGGGITNYVESGFRSGIGLWHQPITGSQGFRGWLGTLRLTNDWFSSANNFVLTLGARIRDDIAASTNLNYLINYGSTVVDGNSAWVFYGNNTGGTQNTNAIVTVNLKGDGGIEIAEFGELAIDGFRLHRGEGSGEASIQQDVSGVNTYALRTSRTNTIVNNLIAYTNVTANAGAFTNGLTLGGTSVSVVGHTHAIADTTGLQTALDGKAATVHAHAISDVTSLQTSLDAKAPLASPALTGTPTAPTASPGNDSTTIATTAYVDAAVLAGGGSDSNWTAEGTTNSTLAGIARVHDIASTNGATFGSGAPAIITMAFGGNITNAANDVSLTNDIPFIFNSNATFNANVTLSNGVGTAGQVFKSAGSGLPPYWADDNESAGSGLEAADIDTSAELLAILTDETGSGALVFAHGNIGTASAGGAPAGDDSLRVANTSWVRSELDSTASGTHATPTTSNPLTPTWGGPLHAVYYGATGEIDLPAAASYTGRAILVYSTGTFTITVDPNASEAIVRDGTLQTGGVSFTLTAVSGDFVYLLSDGTRWITLGYKGTLAEGS